jgi:hypothetical protein
MTKLIVAFRNFADAPKKRVACNNIKMTVRVEYRVMPIYTYAYIYICIYIYIRTYSQVLKLFVVYL